MDYKNLLLEVDDAGVARITINREKVMNSLNGPTLEEMAHCFDACRDDPEVKALVITGAGDKAFVAGADIRELAQMTPLSAKDLAYRGQQVYARVEHMGKPTIAMVNGFALGGGLELALACNLRTASTKARLGLPEVSLGIIPGYGGTQRLGRIAGPAVAREWILTGDMFTAQEGHRVGVINRIFPPEELESGTMAMVEMILSRGPIAVRFAIEAINRGSNIPQREGEILECDLFGLAASTEDMHEGMAAFIEKRKPEFKGR